MLTIAGNGMGKYDFSNLELNFCNYDKIICDPNFIENGRTILKLKFKDAQDYILKNYDKENLLYVVTGSPLFYSAGTSSSVVSAASWAWLEITILSSIKKSKIFKDTWF